MRDRYIILVDDDPLEHIKLKYALEEYDFTMDLASMHDGEEALSYLISNKHNLPELIILDLNMPKMNGVEFLIAAKQEHIIKRVPIVIFTTSDAEEDRVVCFDNHISGYMVKPGHLKDYEQLVGEIMGYWKRSKVAF